MADHSILADLFADLLESVAVYELDGRVLYVNPATERLFGRSLGEIEGRRLWDLYPDAIGNPFHRAFERVAAGAPAEMFDHYYPPFDRWFANRVSRVGDRIHVVARDVTDDVRRRRRLEALARISEVSSGVELAPDPVPDGSGAMTAIAQALREVLRADCCVALLSLDGDWLEVAGRAALDAEALALTSAIQRFPARTGHPGEALETRRPVLADDRAIAAAIGRVDDPALRDVLERLRPTSLLVVPLLVEHDPIGVLTVTRRGEPRLTGDDRALVAELSPGVALYIAHAMRRAEANRLRNRLAALADSNPALVSFVDTDRRYQYVNASYERWFGRSRGDIVGRRIDEVVGPDAWEKLAPYVARALAGTEVRYRGTVPYASGAREVEAIYAPIRRASGEVEGMAVLVTDVTAEARLAAVEEARRRLEQRATRRLQSLLAVTGRLAAAHTPPEIARVVVDDGVAAVEAALGGLWVVGSEGDLELVRERGFRPEHRAAFARIPLGGGGPVADCVAAARPVYVGSRAEYAARWPAVEERHRPEPAPALAFAILPLVVEGRAIGCVNFTFHEDRSLGEDERTFLEVLASHAAEALRRARLYGELRDESETRAAMIAASPAAIVTLDEHGVVRAWNREAERTFGWTAAEAIGRFFPAVGELERESFLTNLGRVIAGEVMVARPARRVRKSGEWLDVELYGAPVHLSDGRTLAQWILVDVTERTRFEKGRALVAEASVALGRSLELEDTLGGFVQLCVRAFSDLAVVDLLEGDELRRIATSRDEVAGIPLPRRLAHDPAYGGVSEAISSTRPHVERDLGEDRLRRMARDDRHLAGLRALGLRSLLSVPMVGPEGVLGALTFGSEHRNFDGTDTQIASDLASHVAAAVQNARLYEIARTARAEAEAANGAKDQFVAMLGHELRNPLAPISTALHLMELRAPTLLASERAVIGRQVAHLTRLVDDLLDVSRITRGKIELKREHTAVPSIVARAIELASPLLEQRRHRLHVDVAPDLFVDGDPMRLGQVLTNLVTNAAKYTEPGGNVWIRARRRGEEVEIAVRDDGIGIPTELLPRIFDVFVQAPRRGEDAGGLGLGLAIVRALVEQHGGCVRAASAGPGTGTELIVRLPAGRSEPSARRAHLGSTSPPAVARRILVVDDNEDALQLLCEVLDARGHRLRTAADGPSALQAAREFHPEVAILDLGLPVMDGYEVAERIRNDAQLDHVRLIAVTGYGQDSDRARSRAAGFGAHLAKPVDLDVLVRLVEDPGP